MRPQISFIAQSRFYSPAFNSAIFDGPLRIYFAQFQEPQALKLYFVAQQRLQELYAKIREQFRKTGVNIFVMLYPSAESFTMSFGDLSDDESVHVERLGVDYVIGVRGPVTDVDVERIYSRIEAVALSLADQLPDQSIELGATVDGASEHGGDPTLTVDDHV